MSEFLYIREDGKQVKLNYRNNHKSLFDLVKYQSIGRWKKKDVIQKKEDVQYLLHLIQKNKPEGKITLLETCCIFTYVMLYDENDRIFTDLRVKPYGYFYVSAEILCKQYNDFEVGYLRAIEEPKNVPNKEILDRKFNQISKEIYNVGTANLIEEMHMNKSYIQYYNAVKKNEVGFYYDVPIPLQKFFTISKFIYTNPWDKTNCVKL